MQLIQLYLTLKIVEDKITLMNNKTEHVEEKIGGGLPNKPLVTETKEYGKCVLIAFAIVIAAVIVYLLIF